VRLRPAGEIERMPELADARHRVLGVSIPLIEIDPAAASAPARVRAAILYLEVAPIPSQTRGFCRD
jgi:hypothetical protein